MAGVMPLGYLSGDSALHRVDARVKLVAVALFSVLIALVDFPGLGAVTLFLGILWRQSKIPFKSLFHGFGYVLFMLGLVFLARVFSTEGPVLFERGPIAVTTTGLAEGGRVSLRLSLVVAMGILLTLCTPSKEVKAAVQWFLKPVPLVPERRVALIMGLMLRMMSLIVEQARLTADAHRARCVELRKNPFYRLKIFSVSFLRSIFLKADQMAIAMSARSFSEDRTDPALQFHVLDLRAMAWIVSGAAMVLLLDFSV